MDGSIKLNAEALVREFAETRNQLARVSDATRLAKALTQRWAGSCMMLLVARAGFRSAARWDAWGFMTGRMQSGGKIATSDDDLLCLVAGGDRHAFQHLVERHARSMLSLAERMTGSPDEADEIAQEAFIKIWLAAPKWRLDGPARFSTWLYRVVLNLCLDRRRRRIAVPLDEIDEPADQSIGAFETIATEQQRALLLAAMEVLPERQRAALSLYYFSEISAREAAEVLEMSVSALESLLVRGKRTLKNILADKGVVKIGDMV